LNIKTEKKVRTEHCLTDVFVLAYLRSLNFCAAFVVERDMREFKADKIVCEFWIFFYVYQKKISYNIDPIILVGTGQTGNICIGGDCRYEFDFNGREFKMIKHLS